MSVQFIDSTKVDVGNTARTNFDLDVPTHRKNNIAIVGIVNADNSPAITLTPPSGWTLKRAKTVLGTIPSSDPVLWVYWRRLLAGEPSDYNWSFSENKRCGGVCGVYSDVDFDDPFLNDTANTPTGQSTSIVCSSINTTFINEMALWFCWNDATTNTPETTQTAWSGSGGTREISESTDNSAATLGMYDETIPSIGATGTRTATLNQSEERGGISMSLRPWKFGLNFGVKP